MSDDRNNDFDDFQGFDGSNDFGDLNADGMHFSEEELEAAMAGFEQEFKDAEASKHERADNPPSEAFDSSEASDNAESSESSESSEVDDMLNAAEDSLKFEDELQGLLGNRAKVAVIITRLTSPRLLSAFCELSDISAQCIGSAQGAVAVLRNLDGDGPEAAVKDMLAGNAFGDAGHRIVIEEFLDGEEASFIVMVDGEHVLPMATSQDHKRVGNGDTGPNTGGMGAYSPAPVVTDEVHQRTMERIIWPTVKGMAAEGNTYTGFLYAGLMIDKQGNPKVIEFNCRFGDPETQPIMLRMKSDLVELCLAACDGKLDEKTSEWDERASLGVVIAAGGYPGNYNTGDEIHGLPLEEIDGAKVFHAGTKLAEDDRVLTNGGRVLCATALGHTVAEAQKRAYALMADIHWNGSFSRQDIGYRAIAREQGE